MNKYTKRELIHSLLGNVIVPTLLFMALLALAAVAGAIECAGMPCGR